MLYEDDNSGDSWKHERPKTLEEIIEAVSKKIFSKNSAFSAKEDQLISKGKSAHDVAQDKIVEFITRNGEENGAKLEENSKWIELNIRKAIGKLYKHSRNEESYDDENFDAKHLACESKEQTYEEKFQIIQKVLDKYSERNKKIIEYRFYEEIADVEIAKITNTTEGNVRKIVCGFYKDCREFGIKLPESKKRRGESNGR